MQHYIRKYFWIVGVVTVMVCAFLAAMSVNHFVEGKYLGESATPPKVQARPPASAATPAPRSKTGDPMAKRNMFCAECTPEEPTGEIVNPADPNAVPLTSLPLELVATNISNDERRSFATIRNSSSNSQGAYWLDNVIPAAGKVVVIAGKYVDFENEQSKRRERISLTGKNLAPIAQATPTPEETPAATTDPKDEFAALVEQGVKQIDETNYEIDVSLRDKVLANPMVATRGARIVPSVKNGKANGFKMYAIRPSSVYAKIGFRNGDTVQAVNGYEMSSPDKMLEVYTKLKDATNLSVTITRRGEPVTLNYTIR